ncbi:MAG: hypothetical protein K6F49_03975 [Saccharofermentans sp.]|nr:hypothetical protein [Saccharofermentans sp.]
MRAVEEYLSGFQEEFNILVYISTGWGGATMLEGYHEVTSYFPAMVDTRTGELIVVDGQNYIGIGEGNSLFRERKSRT